MLKYLCNFVVAVRHRFLLTNRPRDIQLHRKLLQSLTVVGCGVVSLGTATCFAQAPLLPQIIVSFAPPDSVTFGASPLVLTANGGASGNPVVFATTSAATVCTVVTNIVTFVGVGRCDLTANQSGSGMYQAAAQVVAAITILRLVPTLSIFNLPAVTPAGRSGPQFTAFSTPDGTVSVTTATPNVCSIETFPPIFTSASQCLQPRSCPTQYGINARALGVCTVVVTQAAFGNYAEASLRKDVQVVKGSQAIDDFFEFIKLTSVGRVPIELDRNKVNALSTGYSPATFSTPSLPSICTVQGSLLTIVGAGACIVNANRIENAFFEAAQRTGTIPIYAVPAPFSFATQANIPINTAAISNEVTINGVAAETPISITSRYSFDVEGNGYGVSFNAEYSIGCTSAYISTPSVISSGQKVCIRVVTGSSTLGNSTIATLLVGATGAEFKVNASDTGSLVNRYRLFVPSTGGHFFTTNKAEYDYLIKLSGTYVDEGVDHKIYVKPRVQNTSAQAYYRVYIKSVRQHFWTADLGEYLALIKQTDVIVDEGFDGWIFPKAGFPNSVPLYRLVLNNTAIHHWTTDKNEFDTLVRSGSWTAEGQPENPSGVTGYVMPK